VRAGALFLAVAGLAFPIGLALAVYVTSAPSLSAAPVPAAITERAIAEPSPRTTTERERTTTDEGGSDRCLEPEHRLDPECISRSSGSGSSGSDNSGSGSDSSGSGSSGSDNSGSGSGSSGSGSSGSSGSGSSGSGGGDD
jgi:hypothetical protein